MTTKKKQRTKLHHHVTGAHKPHKPFLKRHVGMFGISVLLLVLLVAQFGSFWLYNKNLENKLTVLIQEELAIQTLQENVSVKSSLGFRFDVNPSRYDVVATTLNETGEYVAYDSNNLSKTRAFVGASLRPLGLDDQGSFDTARLGVSSVSLNDLESDVPTEQTLREAAALFSEQSSAAFSVEFTTEEVATINGQLFLKQFYVLSPVNPGEGVVSLGQLHTVVYVTHNDNRAIGMKVTAGSADAASSKFTDVIETVKITSSGYAFEDAATVAEIDTANAEQMNVFVSAYDFLTGTQEVEAADESTRVDGSRISATNIPATVKIWSLFCADLYFNGSSLGAPCTGSTGSGFFVSEDGYIGTNGHVVSQEPKSLYLALLNTPGFIAEALSAAGYSDEEIYAIFSDEATFYQIYAAFASLPAESFTASNINSQYIVGLGDKNPDITDIFNSGLIDKLDEDEDIQYAELIAADFDDETDVDGEFTASDVALIKIEGSNYPTVELGDIDNVTTGSDIVVIGFPGDVENELVDTDDLEPTITIGAVSAIRDTNDGTHKLIQSDIDINHGNSGGPAIASNNKVVGLATYGIFAAERTTSYMRDIKDLIDLADDEDVEIGGTSESQIAWNEGLDLFFESRYSKAIPKFEKAKDLYPNHQLVAQYIDLAETRIENGEDVKDVWPIYLGIAVVVAMVGASAVLIVLHHKRHHKFKATQQQMAMPAGGTPPVPVAPGAQPLPQQNIVPVPPVSVSPTAPVALAPMAPVPVSQPSTQNVPQNSPVAPVQMTDVQHPAAKPGVEMPQTPHIHESTFTPAEDESNNKAA